jgi:hypothetical protein
MKTKVMDELRSMLIEQGGLGEPSQEYIFQNRTTAAKQVFLGLSLEEQANIMDMIEKGSDVVPDEVKLR